VDEEGTEAAAITTIGIQLLSEPKPEIFNVDRPFIFYIYDRVNHLQLFVGRVVDPTGNATPPLAKKD
jgi:serine protease inhibitor